MDFTGLASGRVSSVNVVVIYITLCTVIRDDQLHDQEIQLSYLLSWDKCNLVNIHGKLRLSETQTYLPVVPVV